MPLPNIIEFIGTNITQRKFQQAQEKLLNYLGVEVPTKTELAVKADKTYVDNALTAIAGGHKAYATLAGALSDKSTFPMNSIIEITLDGANNGAYYWNGADLTKSDHDPLTQAKADATTKANAAEANAKAYVSANDASANYSSATFNESKYYSHVGAATNSTLAASTALIPVKADDTVTVFTKVSTSSNPAILIYDALGVFVRGVFPSVTSTPTETTTIIEADGFVRSQWMSGGTPLTDKDGVAKVVINEGAKIFVAANFNDPILLTKADKIGLDTYDSFVLGYVNASGDEIESTVAARSPVYKMLPGTVINFSRPSAGYFFGVNTSQTDKVPHNGTLWINSSSYSITISESNPYVRFFLRNREGTVLDLAKAIEAVKITTSSDVAYNRDVDLKVNALSEKISQAAVFEFNNSFRAPQLATGGVVSIIDDDGQIGVYNTLYPLLKSLDFPFGAAIVPSWVGNADRISFDQLVEMSNDFKYFEVMNHTWSHQNLTGLTNTRIHEEVYKTKQWFTANGFEANGLVLPYGADNDEVQRVVQQYYNSCYDFDAGNGISTFDTIKNYIIKRSSFGIQSDRLTSHKSLVDTVAANNGWLVITTHVNHASYWDANSAADLTELVNYIKSKGCKIMKPRDAFQVFGNIVENQNGFKIAANGKIVGAS